MSETYKLEMGSSSFSVFAELTVKPKAKLQDLADYYSLSREGDAHRALSDVLLLSQVFQRLTIDLKLSVSDLVLRSHTASDIATAMAKTKKGWNILDIAKLLLGYSFLILFILYLTLQLCNRLFNLILKSIKPEKQM